MNNAIRTRTNNSKPLDLIALLTGLLFGGLTGFGAMMLLVPQSGKRTRAQVGRKNKELQERTRDTFDDLMALSHFDNRKILTGTLKQTDLAEFSG